MGTGNVYDSYNTILVYDSHASLNAIEAASVDRKKVFRMTCVVVNHGSRNIIISVARREGRQRI